MLRYGDPDTLTALRRERRKGNPVPALENRPEPTPKRRIAWEIFWALSNSRRSAMGVEPIDVDRVRGLLDEYGFTDRQERLDTIYIVMRLDSVFMEARRSGDEKKPSA